MKQVNVKKLILPNIPYVFIALLATKVSEAVRLAPGSDASAKLLNIMTGLNTAFHSLVPSFHPIDLCVGVAAAIAIRLAVYIKGKNALVLLHAAGGAGQLVAQPAPAGPAGGPVLLRRPAAGCVPEKQERQEVQARHGIRFRPVGNP